MKQLIVAATLVVAGACMMLGSPAEAKTLSRFERSALGVLPIRPASLRAADVRGAQTYNLRGLATLRRGDYKGAGADFTQAIRLDPRYAAAYYNRGLVREYLGDYRGAVADYTQALRLNPRDAAGYYDRGLSRYYLRDYRGAIADYTRAGRLAPTNGAAYYNRALTREVLKDYRGALADYTSSLRIYTAVADAYYRLAWYATSSRTTREPWPTCTKPRGSTLPRATNVAMPRQRRPCARFAISISPATASAGVRNPPTMGTPAL